MKLKDGITIEDKGNYFQIDFSKYKVKKITSRTFPILLGKNNFTSIGYGVLERANLIVFEEIDKFYTLRGDIAEKITKQLVIDFYKHKEKVDIELKVFKPQDFKGFDMFDKSYKWGNEYFGGVPDLTITKPSEFRTVIEVKSKNIKSYDYIIEKNRVPEEEIMQGEMLSTLSKAPNLIMAYIFFTDEQENVIKDGLANNKTADQIIEENKWNYRVIKSKFKLYDIDMDKTYKEMEKAKKFLDDIIASGKVSKQLFNVDELMIIEQIATPDRELSKVFEEEINIDDTFIF